MSHLRILSEEIFSSLDRNSDDVACTSCIFVSCYMNSSTGSQSMYFNDIKLIDYSVHLLFATLTKWVLHWVQGMCHRDSYGKDTLHDYTLSLLIHFHWHSNLRVIFQISWTSETHYSKEKALLVFLSHLRKLLDNRWCPKGSIVLNCWLL